jgi:hydroxysqualene dehydroxylase
MKIAVIGGGVAGICAAIAARDSGAEVVLYESTYRLGGRVAGAKGADTGRHLIPSAYSNFLKLTDRLGSTKEINFKPQSLGINIDGDSSIWKFKSRFVSRKISPALNLFRSDFLPKHERLKAILALNRLIKSDIVEPSDDDLINGQIEDILFQNGTVQELFKRDKWPEEMIERIGIPLTLAMFNATPENADALSFINSIKRLVSDKRQKAGWAKDPAKLISEPALTILPEMGINLKLRNKVISTTFSIDQWYVYAKERATFDKIIVTTPPGKMDFLKDCSQADKLSECCNGVKGNAIITISGTFSNGTLMEGPFTEYDSEDYAIWFCEKNRDGSLKIEKVISGVDRANSLDRDKMKYDFLQKAKQIYKAADSSDVNFIFYSNATPTVDHRQKRPGLIHGDGLFYAGDFSSTGLPATLESAARSGWLAGKIASIGE